MRHHPVDQAVIKEVCPEENQEDDEKTDHRLKVKIKEFLQAPQSKHQVNDSCQGHHAHV